MKNKLSDLNDHLFEEIERLNDETIKGDALTEEIERAKAISLVGRQIIDNANLALQASKQKSEGVVVPMTMLAEESPKLIAATPTKAPEQKTAKYPSNLYRSCK